MAQPISFDDLVPQKGRPQLPSRAPAVPAGLFGDKTAPGGFGGMVAKAIGAKDPAYQAAMAREQALNKYRPPGTALDHTVDPFMPYVGAGLSYLGQGVENMYRSATGQPIQIPAATAAQATADNERARNTAWAQAHPAQSLLANVLGAAATGPRLGPGFVAARAPAATTLGGKALNAAKTIGAGGLLGGVYGAAQAPDGQHLKGMAQGAAVGAAAPVVLSAATRLAAPVVGGAARIANKATGGRLLDPAKRVNDVLAQTLAADFRARGVAPQDIPAAIQKQLQLWSATGSPTPNLMDVAGENTRAAMRTAASQVGPGRTAAQEFADRTAANLQGQAINRTRQLTPMDSRPADQVLEALKAQRAADAETQYRAPYAAPVDPAPVMDALKGDAAAKGIGRAILESDAMRLQPQTDELRALRLSTDPADTAAPPVLPPRDPATAPPVTLGTLDRVKVAYNGLGQDAEANGVNGAATGYYDRAKQIDDYLANLPGPEGDQYRQARDNYARLSGHMDAMKAGDINVANADPDMFSAAAANMTPEERRFAQIQLRQNLTNAIGSPTEGAVGVLNKIGTSDNATRNLATMFGPDEAANYQAAIKNAVGQVNNARFVAPNTGPKSANVLLDADAATRPHHLSLDPMDWVMAARRAGMLLTPQESEMLVRAGQAPASMNVPTASPNPAASWLLPAGAPAGTIANSIRAQQQQQEQGPQISAPRFDDLVPPQ